MHVSACFHPGFHAIDLGRVLKYSFQIRRIENYDVHRKMFDTINLAFTKKGTFLYNENKIGFFFKKGCFIGPKISDFGPESAQRGCFPSLGASVVYVFDRAANICVRTEVAAQQGLFEDQFWYHSNDV